MLLGSNGLPLQIIFKVQFDDPLRPPFIWIVPTSSNMASKSRGCFLAGGAEFDLGEAKLASVLIVGEFPTPLLILLPLLQLLLLLLLLPGDAFFFFPPPEIEFRRAMEDIETTLDGRTLDAVGAELLVAEAPDEEAPPPANGRPRGRLRLPVEDDFPGVPFLVGKPLPMDGIVTLISVRLVGISNQDYPSTTLLRMPNPTIRNTSAKSMFANHDGNPQITLRDIPFRSFLFNQLLFVFGNPKNNTSFSIQQTGCYRNCLDGKIPQCFLIDNGLNSRAVVDV